MRIFLFIIVAGLFFGCSTESREYQKAADAEEAGREFIRASLDGNYEKAKFYLYQDSSNTNLTLLERWRADYNLLPQEDKISYKEANIIALSILPENDSTVNYTYSNSFKRKDTTTLKIIRVNGEWLVDFKDLH